MRDFLDAILAFIGAESLTDEEFAYSEIDALETQEYSVEVYSALVVVLDARELVSSMRDKLKYYFQARGTEVVAPTAARSEIFLGAVIDPCS